MRDLTAGPKRCVCIEHQANSGLLKGAMVTDMASPRDATDAPLLGEGEPGFSSGVSPFVTSTQASSPGFLGPRCVPRLRLLLEGEWRPLLLFIPGLSLRRPSCGPAVTDGPGGTGAPCFICRIRQVVSPPLPPPASQDLLGDPVPPEVTQWH